MRDLGHHTIFLTLAGSQAHGTAREGSDVDLRGVCVAPLDVRLSLFTRFEQHEGPLDAVLEQQVIERLRAHEGASRGLHVKLECVIYDVAKFLTLCATANPGALELLFADEADWLLATPAWHALHAKRHVFLTQQVQQTFLGYAQAQLKRIEGHRAWLRDPPAGPPRREDFGFPEDPAAARQAHQQYRAAQRRWTSFVTWAERRNPARAALERAHGYDTKHAMHLVRLMRMGIEALTHGDLRVRREDAEVLCAIRDGALSFEELLAEAERLTSDMERAALTTQLPKTVDTATVDALALNLMMAVAARS